MPDRWGSAEETPAKFQEIFFWINTLWSIAAMTYKEITQSLITMMGTAQQAILSLTLRTEALEQALADAGIEQRRPAPKKGGGR